MKTALRRLELSARSPGAQRSRSGGFTVIELIIAMTVMAVLISIAVPNLRGLIARNQLLGQANEFSGALALARAEAATRGVPAAVCASTDGSTCSGSASDWDQFMLVYADVDGSGTLNTGDPLLKIFQGHPEVDQLTNTGAFVFGPTGFSTLGGTSTIDICHRELVDGGSENPNCRRVSVQPSGVVTVRTHGRVTEVES